MKRLNTVFAAETDGPSPLAEMIKDVEEDFSYLISGLEKLDRTSPEASNKGLEIIQELELNISDAIVSIAEDVKSEIEE